jgi:hypothetical protein
MLLGWLTSVAGILLVSALMYPAHRNWRFSVRWLFAVMTLLGVFLGLVAAGGLSPPE